MTTFTISVPEGMKSAIDSHPEINWAEFLKQRFSERMDYLAKTKRRSA